MDFGWDPDNPIPALARLAGFAIALYGVLSDNRAAFWTGIGLGLLGVLMGVVNGWKKPGRKMGKAEFDRALDDYVEGRRDDLPE